MATGRHRLRGADALVGGVANLLDVGGLEAGRLAERLGPDGAQHVLRFTLTDDESGLVGGYSVVVR